MDLSATNLTRKMAISQLRGVQAYHFGNFNYEIRVEEEGQDTSRLFRVVLGPCAQFSPCEASEQKGCQTPKS